MPYDDFLAPNLGGGMYNVPGNWVQNPNTAPFIFGQTDTPIGQSMITGAPIAQPGVTKIPGPGPVRANLPPLIDPTDTSQFGFMPQTRVPYGSGEVAPDPREIDPAYLEAQQALVNPARQSMVTLLEQLGGEIKQRAKDDKRERLNDWLDNFAGEVLYPLSGAMNPYAADSAQRSARYLLDRTEAHKVRRDQRVRDTQGLIRNLGEFITSNDPSSIKNMLAGQREQRMQGSDDWKRDLGFTNADLTHKRIQEMAQFHKDLTGNMKARTAEEARNNIARLKLDYARLQHQKDQLAEEARQAKIRGDEQAAQRIERMLESARDFEYQMQKDAIELNQRAKEFERAGQLKALEPDKDTGDPKYKGFNAESAQDYLNDVLKTDTSPTFNQGGAGMYYDEGANSTVGAKPNQGAQSAAMKQYEYQVRAGKIKPAIGRQAAALELQRRRGLR